MELIPRDISHGVAGGHDAAEAVGSRHAADIVASSRDISHGVAVGHDTVVASRHAADIVGTGYVHSLQRQVLHLAAGAEKANQPHIVCFRLVDGQPRDGMVAAIEGAVVGAKSAYRRPLLACQVDVGFEGAVGGEVAPCDFVPCQQPVDGVDHVGVGAGVVDVAIGQQSRSRQLAAVPEN